MDASRRFLFIKYTLHLVMALVAIYTIVQLSLIYTENAVYGNVSPTEVSAFDFIESQREMAWYSFYNIKLVFIEQGAFFILDALLLYTSIFFLVSIMNDLGH